MHGVERHATSGEIPQFQKLTSSAFHVIVLTSLNRRFLSSIVVDQPAFLLVILMRIALVASQFDHRRGGAEAWNHAFAHLASRTRSRSASLRLQHSGQRRLAVRV